MIINPTLRANLITLGWTEMLPQTLWYKQAWRSRRANGFQHPILHRIHIRASRGDEARGVIEFSDRRAEFDKFEFRADAFNLEKTQAWFERAKVEHARLDAADAALDAATETKDKRRQSEDEMLTTLTGRLIGRFSQHEPKDLSPRYRGEDGSIESVTFRITATGNGVAEIARKINAAYAAPQLLEVLTAIVNGRVLVSDKANDALSEHDPNVIRARALIAKVHGSV